MLKVLTGLLDRVMFTATFILGVQLPEFLQQYTQRLGGHLDEASLQLQKFQQIADNHYQGDLFAMLSKYRSNSDSSIVETGDAIHHLMERISSLEIHLSDIMSSDLAHRWYSFFINCDIGAAQATLSSFQLAIPLEAFALLFGLGAALFLLTIERCVCHACIYTYRKFTPDMPQIKD